MNNTTNTNTATARDADAARLAYLDARDDYEADLAADLADLLNAQNGN